MKRIIVLLLSVAVFVLGNGLMLKNASGYPGGAEGGGDGGGGIQGCNGPGWSMDTCYGATWRYYETDSDSVEIYGRGVGDAYAYAKPELIHGCARAGGYWRYAMVAYGSNNLVDRNGNIVGTYNAGDQVGVVGISGNSNSVYNSRWPGYEGSMNYIGTWDDWEYVHEKYNEAQALYPSVFTLGFEPGSNLSWFCAESPDTTPPVFYSESNVSARDYKGTGVVENGEANATAVSINVGESVPLVFSHNIYSSRSVEHVYWQLQRNMSGYVDGHPVSGTFVSMSDGGANYSINTSGEAPGYSGYANLTVEGDYDGDAHFTAEERPYVNGDRSFLIRDDYGEVTFNKEGHFTFCETMYIGATPVEHTKACVEIDVGTPPLPPPTPSTEDLCEQWAPSSYYNSDLDDGVTSVVSAVHTNLVSFSDWTLSNGIDSVFFSGKEVWAKPGDEISWMHCYYPGVQTTAFTEATRRHHGHISSDGGSFPNDNDSISNIIEWQNKFDVTNNGLVGDGINHTYNSPNYATGNTDIRKWKELPDVEKYVVKTDRFSRAGESLKEIITTGTPSSMRIRFYDYDWTWSCPPCTTDEETGHTSCSECSANHGSNSYWTYSYEGPVQDSAMVKVPYNYNNTISVNIDRNGGCFGGVVCAGETVKIGSASVTVHPKQNDVTQGNYATRVDGSEVRLIGYISGDGSNQAGNSASVDGEALDLSDDENVGWGSYGSNLCDAILNKDDCAEIAVDEGSSDYDCVNALNCIENTGGTTEQVFSGKSYNVFDAPAGSWYCVVAAVYPANSGSPKSMSGAIGSAGNDKWRLSRPDCIKVAKKPSIQVWGNSLYTNGKVTTASADKRVVAGFHDFADSGNYYGGNANNSSNLTVFGSWVEQSIVTPSDLISGLASGAATGNFSSNTALFGSRSDKDPLGGSHEGSNSSFCKYRAPLTFPNSCYPGYDAVGGNDSEGLVPEDKEKLISQFSLENSGARGDEIGYNYTEEASIDSITDFASQKMDGSFIIPPGTTWVINHDGDFTIDKDITYLNDTYILISDIPKLIIYASGDIEINCDVSRVDAILIAGGDVNTCPDISTTSGVVDTPDSAKATKQLKIFGTVITNTLTANRIYGAASGVNSAVPAEIIDYDSSIYLWGTKRANVGASGKTSITYQTELPPRY